MESRVKAVRNTLKRIRQWPPVSLQNNVVNVPQPFLTPEIRLSPGPLQGARCSHHHSNVNAAPPTWSVSPVTCDMPPTPCKHPTSPCMQHASICRQLFRPFSRASFQLPLSTLPTIRPLIRNCCLASQAQANDREVRSWRMAGQHVAAVPSAPRQSFGCRGAFPVPARLRMHPSDGRYGISI
jgi:hypothetical protein